MVSKLAMTAAAVGTAFVLAAAPAQAQHWRGHHGGWHHGGGIGAGIAGFAAGALIGGAVASGPYYRGYGPDYGYGYDYAPEYGYDYAPGPMVVERSGGGGVAYCEQRYRSYDPSSGTFLGYDGMRHPCP